MIRPEQRSDSDMAKSGLPSKLYHAAILALVLGLSAAAVCNGGKTSAFVRKLEESVDMPVDSDVFQVPPGYNAPQQVLFFPLRFAIM